MERHSTRSGEYQQALQTVISHFWYRCMDGHIPSMAELKERWELTYRREDDYAVRGLESLYRFHVCLGQRPGQILGVNLDRTITLEEHRLDTRIDLIRKNGDHIELVVVRSGRPPQEFAIASDMALISGSLAFRRMARREESRTVVFYPERNRLFEVQYHKSHFRRLQVVTNYVADSIERSIYLPRYPCNGCEYQKQCL